MNLQELRYLVAIAEHRHFGRAAEACFVSQPTLSTQIKKLERELGVQLVERNPRQVMMTETGERIVERARIILGETDSITEIARQAIDPEAASLRIGLFPTLAPYLLPHVVPSLHTRFPNLELLLVEEKTEVVLQRLRDGKLDAGVLALPVPDEQLHVEPLFTEEFVLALPAAHPLASVDGPVDPSVLAGEPGRRREGGPRPPPPRGRRSPGPSSRPGSPASTSCCSRRDTACATRRCRCASSSVPRNGPGSVRPASRRCARWSLRESA